MIHNKNKEEVNIMVKTLSMLSRKERQLNVNEEREKTKGTEINGK